jgi:hypothetical protein
MTTPCPTEVGVLAEASFEFADVTIFALEKQDGQFVRDERFDGEITSIPEAGTVLLLASGLAALAAARRRRRA